MIGDHHCDSVVRDQPCRTGTHRLCRRIAEHEGKHLFLIGIVRRISLDHIAAARLLYRERETRPRTAQ